MSRLIFYYGTMASGKSLQLLTFAYSLSERHIPVTIIKSNVDTRDNDRIESRIGSGISQPCILIGPEEKILNKIDEIPKYILVDEAQFLTPAQVDELADIVDKYDIEVVCYGLRTDFTTHLFPGSARLFEIADKIQEIKSTCDCGRKNTVNARISKTGSFEITGPSIECGGDGRYTAVCRKCWKKNRGEN